jgi:capsule polysaccharide export protein KpsE/RkpR
VCVCFLQKREAADGDGQSQGPGAEFQAISATQKSAWEAKHSAGKSLYSAHVNADRKSLLCKEHRIQEHRHMCYIFSVFG